MKRLIINHLKTIAWIICTFLFVILVLFIYMWVSTNISSEQGGMIGCGLLACLVYWFIYNIVNNEDLSEQINNEDKITINLKEDGQN